jgi:protein Tex
MIKIQEDKVSWDVNSWNFQVSIARRLQDPLTEYVRVSPQHLGIGMYQHDVPVKRLESSLDDIVCECVSFVGVDLNTCPLHVLRYSVNIVN